MIPAKYAPVLFGLILSGFMSLIVSGISTAKAIGLTAAFFGEWMAAWATSWAIAFPIVLVAAPMARKLVARLTTPGGQ